VSILTDIVTFIGGMILLGIILLALVSAFALASFAYDTLRSLYRNDGQ